MFDLCSLPHLYLIQPLNVSLHINPSFLISSHLPFDFHLTLLLPHLRKLITDSQPPVQNTRLTHPSIRQTDRERERDRVNELKDAANERISYIYCVCPLSPKEARFHLIVCVVTHKAASFSEPVVLNWWIVTQNWVCKLHRKTNAKWK